MKKISLLFFVLFTPVIFSQETNPVAKIEAAYHAGKITREEARHLKYLFLYQYDRLPKEFQSDKPVKCAFGIHNELIHDVQYRTDVKIKKRTAQFIFVHSFISKGQTKKFHIHYDTSGTNAVPTKDMNQNNLPDWIEETASALERAYRLEVDTLGYREPPNFSIYGFYNVFILNLGSYYGSTTPDSQVTTNPRTYTSYMELENDYAENFYTKGYDALRVTCAHEFHHAVQLAYQNTYENGDGWFYEATSTWMEDVVFPEVNDYLDYLRFYFNQPHLALEHFNGQHEYAIAIWNHFAQKRYNRLIIRKVWEKLPQMKALQAWDLVLSESTNDVLSTAIIEFCKWNYFTSYRADTVNYYQEGYLYPSLQWQSQSALTDSLLFSHNISLSSSRWYRFYLMNSTHVEIGFKGSPANQHFYMLGFRKRYNEEPVIEYFPAASRIFLENLNSADTLFIAVINKTWQSPSSFSYQFTVKPTSTAKENFDLKVYPNPIKIVDPIIPLRFSFRLTKRNEVFYEIFSTDGKLIYRSERMDLLPDVYSGNKALTWELKDRSKNTVSSGVYIYRLTIGHNSRMGKIAVIRNQ